MRAWAWVLTLVACIIILSILLVACGAVGPALDPAPPRYVPTGPMNPAIFETLDIDNLVVAEPDPARPRYNREQWDGGGWADVDGDGCNTRAEVLQLESLAPTVSKSPTNCTVVTGEWVDPYTGSRTTSAADLQIDHLVSLGDAARSGGWAWPDERKHEFANNLDDQLELNATVGAENQRKADYGPDRWLPPAEDFVCTYIASYVTIKQRWGLTVSPAQHDALVTAWTACSETP